MIKALLSGALAHAVRRLADIPSIMDEILEIVTSNETDRHEGPLTITKELIIDLPENWDNDMIYETNRLFRKVFQ